MQACHSQVGHFLCCLETFLLFLWELASRALWNCLCCLCPFACALSSQGHRTDTHCTATGNCWLHGERSQRRFKGAWVINHTGLGNKTHRARLFFFFFFIYYFFLNLLKPPHCQTVIKSCTDDCADHSTWSIHNCHQTVVLNRHFCITRLWHLIKIQGWPDYMLMGNSALHQGGGGELLWIQHISLLIILFFFCVRFVSDFSVRDKNWK